MPEPDRYQHAVAKAAWTLQAVGVTYLLQAALFVVLMVLEFFGIRDASGSWALATGPFMAVYGAGLLYLGIHLIEKDNLRESLILIAMLAPGPIWWACTMTLAGTTAGIIAIGGPWLAAALHVVAVVMGLRAYRLRPKATSGA